MLVGQEEEEEKKEAEGAYAIEAKGDEARMIDVEEDKDALGMMGFSLSLFL